MFKVMTWNVENLFLPGQPSGPESQAIYEQKLHGLATVINTQQPDALALQEIGNPQALADLVDRLDRMDGVWHQRISQHPDSRGIRVAWLTTRPIDAHENILTFPHQLQPVQTDDTGTPQAQMGRGALAITITSDAGTPIQLITTHLKSKLLTYPGGRFTPHDEDERARYGAYALYRRAAEAATLRVAATQALAGQGRVRPVILTGDLNDTVQAATTQVLLGPPGSEIGTGGFDPPDNGEHHRLWNLAPIMPEGKNYSRINQGRKELIDHILVSCALVKPLTSVTCQAIIAAPLPSVGPDPNARLNQPSSDHAPIIATFANL
ncbi:MAG TPA: endonuclease/exonuclease/phosphatase family protein [Propionibacteriaceae bacterium]|nr:endonuclease/exonuclease/phosphatase family protein [Propionibacteriaceae bacterium]